MKPLINMTLCMFIGIIVSNAQIDSGYVDIKSGVLFYRIWGEGDPVVFINGGPGLSSKGYEVYAEETSKNNKVILFDQRGTGKSIINQKKNGIFYNDMLKDIERLRKHLNFEKWSVYGHSYGGELAMRYTAKYPNKVNKLILSATASLDNDIIGNIQQFRDIKINNYSKPEYEVLKLYLEEKAKKNPSKMRLKRLGLALRTRFYVKHPKNYQRLIDWWLYKCEPSVKKYFYQSSSISMNNKFKRKLKHFENPVLIIHGLSDFINISNPNANHSLFPNSSLVFMANSGHIMSIDVKEEYFDKINQFLSK